MLEINDVVIALRISQRHRVSCSLLKFNYKRRTMTQRFVLLRRTSITVDLTAATLLHFPWLLISVSICYLLRRLNLLQSQLAPTSIFLLSEICDNSRCLRPPRLSRTKTISHHNNPMPDSRISQSTSLLLTQIRNQIKQSKLFFFEIGFSDKKWILVWFIQFKITWLIINQFKS